MNSRSLSEIAAWLAACVDRDARRVTVQAVMAMLASSFCTMGGSAALALAVSGAVGGQRAAAFWLLLAAAAIGAGRLLDVFKSRAYALAEFALERALTRRVFRATVGANRHQPVGGRLQELMTIVLGGRLIFQHVVFTAPSAVVDAVFAAAFLLLFGQPAIAAFLVVFACAYVWLAFRLAKPIGACARAAAEGRVVSSACFGDALLNMDVVRWYGALEFVTASFDRAFDRVSDDNVRLTDARTRASWWTACAFALGYTGCLALAWFGADNPASQIRDVVLANMCVLTLIRPLELAGQAMRDLALAGEWVAPIGALDPPAAPLNRPGVPAATGISISVRRASFGYAHERLLDDVSFEIAKGAVIGLKGPSGVGKSSLLRLLIGDLRPAAGEVTWDGGDAPPSFAVAPQETLLLDDSVFANIAFGRKVSADDVARAAALVELDRVLAQSGRDLSFDVGERGRGLSGGERQRLALARAVVDRRSLYVFDEATAALDVDSECAVLSKVVASLRGSTIVIVSHRESAFSLCDSVLELSAAKVLVCVPASRANVDIGTRS